MPSKLSVRRKKIPTSNSRRKPKKLNHAKKDKSNDANSESWLGRMISNLFLSLCTNINQNDVSCPESSSATSTVDCAQEDIGDEEFTHRAALSSACSKGRMKGHSNRLGSNIDYDELDLHNLYPSENWTTEFQDYVPEDSRAILKPREPYSYKDASQNLLPSHDLHLSMNYTESRQSPANEPPRDYGEDGLPYLVPEACGDEKNAEWIDGVPSIDDSVVACQRFQLELECKLNKQRQLEREDFRFAISVAETEMPLSSKFVSVIHPATVSPVSCNSYGLTCAKSFQQPKKDYGSSYSMISRSPKSSTHCFSPTPSRVSFGIDCLEDIDMPASKHPSSLSNSRFFPPHESSTSKISTLDASAGKVAKSSLPGERDIALEMAIKASKMEAKWEKIRQISKNTSKHSSKENDEVLQYALDVSLEESIRQSRRIDIREKLAVSRAMVASVYEMSV